MDQLSRFVTRNARTIEFVTLALAAAGVYAAFTMPTSVFPQTDFPRVVVLVDSGVMPADQMMATITRPIEEAMNDIPGVASIRSATSRGSAEINVFFDWKVDMIQSLMFVQGRLAQIAGQLPSTASLQVWRLTFSAFPIIGISLTAPDRDIGDLWETARYVIKPRLARVNGVARVDLVGGREPEFHVVADPAKLAAAGLTLTDLVERLRTTNLVAPAGMLEQNHQLYLTLVSGRVAIFVRDVARVERGVAPGFNIVTAQGVNAVLLNIRSQPDASTLEVAAGVEKELAALRATLPGDMKLAHFYDQSILVRESARSVWECIVFGLVLSIGIMVAFLKDVRLAGVAVLVIPLTVLITIAAMKPLHLSFNLMTLGGIAAAIGLVIDDAIVVIENIHTKRVRGLGSVEAVQEAIREIGLPLVGSTLTPVVVFVPLAFLDGVPGVFFRSLALTMVTALLASLVLALAVTPNLALRFLKRTGHVAEGGGRAMSRLLDMYGRAVRGALERPWLTFAVSAAILGAVLILYRVAETGFLPEQDEGAFVLDYFTPPGTSLSETNRSLLQVEDILKATPEVESYSRRTGARLALAISEPNTGDFLVKLEHDRKRSVEQVTDELREKIHTSQPVLHVEFAGILNDLIGDLTWSPAPIEVKVFSPDEAVLRAKAREIAGLMEHIDGVVDVFDGVVVTGPALTLRADPVAVARAGLDVDQVGRLANTAILGDVASFTLKGDIPINIRVRAEADHADDVARLRKLLLKSPSGTLLTLDQLGALQHEGGQTEIRREDLRQSVAVQARLSGRDLGSAVAEIRRKVGERVVLPPGAAIEYGGFYKQQQEAFRNLLFVLLMAVVLVFTVLLAEFGRFAQPLAIVWGALLSLFGVFAALAVTHTTFNIISFLGAIIGVGIVAKNGILLLDSVEHFERTGHSLADALVLSGQRRLRPVLMTSLAAALGMLPLALGVGSGAQMLRPLAIAVMGGLAISVLLALVATPVAYFLIRRYARSSAAEPEEVQAVAS
ncbi:MAG: efflux RND transporter permease subunit [Deltaproteobacteria bacterium]|nr:MAG: efflux RND transporter permease subunit [Deltaproteobacteria bacterium]